MSYLQMSLIIILIVVGVSHCQPNVDLDTSPPKTVNNCKYIDLPILHFDKGHGALTPPVHELENNAELMRKLGDDYDEEFMSITRPSRRRLPVEWKLKGETPKYIRTQNLKRYPDGTNMKVGLSYLRSRQKIRKWLWARTHCPVKYTWKNLGKRFWPRWLKVGECHQTKESCSIPSGLNCLPVNSTEKRILFWACIDDRSDRKFCQWINVPYPVLTECRCGGNCGK
ncbi:noggin-2-like [Glandiceps talaboti]